MGGGIRAWLRLVTGRRPYLADVVLAGSVLAAGLALGHQGVTPRHTGTLSGAADP